jgi:hypothetical protein
MTASRAPLHQPAPRPIPRSIPQRRVKPKPKSQAQLLQRLQVIQNITVASALLLTGGVFVLYGWSVHTQKRWNQQYSKLEHYKQVESRLINAAEALDHALLNQKIQEGNWRRATPDRTIFVEELPSRPPVPVEPLPPENSNPLPVAY